MILRFLRKGIRVQRYIILFIVILESCSFGQSLRGLVNEGVDQYSDKKYPEAEVNFKKGLEASPNSFQAEFNLGDSYFRQQRYDEAVKSFQQSIVKTDDKNLKAQAFHNIGNSLLKAQKLKESVEAFKQSLKLNPYDKETKYNLSYALNLMKDQQQNQQNQNQQQNQNDKDKNKDKQDQQNKDNQNQNKDQQDKQQNPQDNEAKQDNTKQDQKQPKADKQKISKEEAERILNAIKNNEQELQNKIRKHKGKRVPTEKDW